MAEGAKSEALHAATTGRATVERNQRSRAKQVRNGHLTRGLCYMLLHTEGVYLRYMPVRPTEQEWFRVAGLAVARRTRSHRFRTEQSESRTSRDTTHMYKATVWSDPVHFLGPWLGAGRCRDRESMRERRDRADRRRAEKPRSRCDLCRPSPQRRGGVSRRGSNLYLSGACRARRWSLVVGRCA